MPYEAPFVETNATFITEDRSIELAVDDGETLMEVAVRNGVPGITGDCGGGGACGTCQIVIAEAWREAAGEASELELAMLEADGDPQPGARLACQVQMAPNLRGVVITVVSR